MTDHDPRTRSHHRRRCDLTDESGVALVVAMGAMLLIAVMTAAAVALANQTASVTRSGAATRQAFQAAQAGLEVALYRYNMLNPSGGSCVGDGVGTPSPTSGTCTSSKVTLGNGATYQYSTTPIQGSTGTCVGAFVVNAKAGINNICVTATGISQGRTVRSEIRAASFAGTPLFPFSGIVGLQSIVHNGSTSVNAAEVTNGTIYVRGNLTGGSNYNAILGPMATLTVTGTSTGVTRSQLSSPVVLSPVNPGGSATANNNTAYLGTGTVLYNAATRSLSTQGNSSITFTGGIYNYCSFTTSGSSVINVAPGASVTIYIDSPSDPGSNCPAGSGQLSLSGSTSWSNPNVNPTALQLYVYGPDAGPNAITFNGSSTLHGTLYAPTSDVNLNGSLTFDGAISANNVQFNGSSSFLWESQASLLQAGTKGLYYRTAWGRCTQTPSGSSPMSGCG